MTVRYIHGDFWEKVKGIDTPAYDAIVTDPLYDVEFNEEMMNVFRRICRGHIIMFCAPENQFFKPDEYAFWIKQPSTKNNFGSKRLSRFVEMILVERHGDTFNTNLHWSNYTGVYDDRLLWKQRHPFEKPISLLERLIALYTNPGDVILDPFAGSGSTLWAARNLGRSAIGIEKSSEYYNMFYKEFDGLDKL